MTTLKKRMLLHCILALGIFLGFGFISLPGPHGGLILTIGWLADILIHPVDGVKSLLLFYLPIAGLVGAGFLNKDLFRIVISHIAVLVLIIFFILFLSRIYPPVRYLVFLTGVVFILSLAGSIVLPLIVFRSDSHNQNSIIIECILFMIAAVIAVGTLYSSNVPEEKIRINIHSCKTNLDLIGFLLKTYAEDNIQYPSADQWCDILTETNSFIEDKYWTCPQAGSGKCHYAINPNTKPDSPASMVLVFETKAGWNQHGNQDIVVMNRHEESGCYILFNDKHVEFIQAEKIKTLQWE